MKPQEIGKAYDTITHLWQSQKFDRNNGIEAHNRAIAFVKDRGFALDVGCGCTGRFIDLLLESDFTPEGVDVSEGMIDLTRQKASADKVLPSWYKRVVPSKHYDFVTVWDSIWHVPLSE